MIVNNNLMKLNANVKVLLKQNIHNVKKMTYNLDLKSQIISTILGKTEGRSKNMINFSPLSGMKPLDFSFFFSSCEE